jgi:leucyl-tRNA synthetase
MTKCVENRFFPIINHFGSSEIDLKDYFKKEEMSLEEFRAYVRLNQTIQAVTRDIEELQVHTMIAAIMKFLNDFKPESLNQRLVDYCILKLIQLIAPLAPCLAEEMWEIAGQPYSVCQSAWPKYDPDAIVADTITIAVQVNGRLRGEINVPADSDEAAIKTEAKANEKVTNHIKGKKIIKEIYIKGRLVNIVVK